MRLLDTIPLRRRLTIVYAFWMAIVLPILGWGVYQLVERNLLQSVDAALSASAQAMIDSRSRVDVSVVDQLLSSFLGERQINASARIVDLSGKVRIHGSRGEISLPMTNYAMRRAERGLSSFETFERKAKSNFRMLTVPVIQDGLFSSDVVQVGASLETTENALRGIGAVLWLAFPISMLVILAMGYYLTAGSLAPVEAIQKAASNLRGSDLSTRLPLPKANDELRRLTSTFNGMLDRLEDTFGRLRRFSSDVSHELRTPLAAIRGEAELALRRERTGDQYKETIATIQRESMHMTKIVEDLLLLARAESRSVAYNPSPVSASAFIEACVDASKAFFLERKVSLSVDCRIPGEISCASGYLTQALLNILLNAAKHSQPGQTVSLIAETRGSEHWFMVSDQGEGISEEQVSRIFDPFYRIDSARNRLEGGAGIGLSLALALVKLHDGTIDVSSIVGKGSTFTIKIPDRAGNI
jgi:heavy metal sensor kinase